MELTRRAGTMTRSAKLGALACAFVAAVLSGVSCKSEETVDCSTACAKLQACSMLPSVLGVASPEGVSGEVSAEQNCAERCARTPDASRDPILDCARDNPVENAKWCVSSDCSELAACLLGEFPGVPVTGLASVQVEAWAPTCAEGQAAPKLALDYCAPLTMNKFPGCPWSSRAQAWCNPNSTVQAFVVQGEARRFGITRRCAEGLGRHTIFQRVTPGNLTAGIRVTYPRSDGAGGEGGTPAVPLGPDCREYQADVVVKAGARSTLVAVQVAELAAGALVAARGSPCEVCDDQGDNDGDGLVDCDDPQCLLDCEEPTKEQPTAEGEDAGAAAPFSSGDQDG
jgi:hypothetical protein